MHVSRTLGGVRGSHADRDFTDIEILQRFQESLPQLLRNQEGQVEHYFGISLRELIHEFKWQTLVLFKCALLQPKVCTQVMREFRWRC
jgi:hypothetical protein